MDYTDLTDGEEDGAHRGGQALSHRILIHCVIRGQVLDQAQKVNLNTVPKSADPP